MKAFSKILLFGTTIGIKQLIARIPVDRIAGIVAPSIRPFEVAYIKEIADYNQITFLVQPKFNTKDYFLFIKGLSEIGFDSIISNCYSMIIRPDVLDMCQYNAVNVHWSYLPYNRGPNPIQWAIIRGEGYTGVTLHFISDLVDGGDIVDQIKVSIEEYDSWVTLEKKLIQASDELLDLSLPKLFLGRYDYFRQDNDIATQNPRLNEDSPLIDLKNMSDYQVFNLIRAQVEPLKGAYVIFNSNKIHFPKVLKIRKIQLLRAMYGK